MKKVPKKSEFDVVVVCQVFYPEMVSTGQTLTELVEELATYGLRIKVIAAQPTILSGSDEVDKIIEYKGIRIVRTWSTRFSKISFFGKLINLFTFFVTSSIEVVLRDKKVPLLLLTNPPYLPILGWIGNFLTNTKFGVLLFDIMPEQAELLNIVKRGGLLARLWMFLNKIWYQKADYVVVLSKDMLDGAIDNANLNGHKKEMEYRQKTHIIHVWSDDRIISPIPKSQSKETLRLGALNKFVIQYSGNHGRFHDIETLLGITKALKGREELLFQFIGEGYKKSLVIDYRDIEKAGNLYVSSYVDKSLLSDSLAMADLGVVAQLPGQERVCYPSKLLGIMASGRPILAICPEECEMARMIVENNLGFVIGNGKIEEGVSVIDMVSRDKALLSKMGKNAFEYLKGNLTLEKAAKKYFELIKKTNN
jgi:glycosyltransferase involved in cell wall biosynthesis